MIVNEIPIAGAFVLAPDLQEDERGFFARTFCREEFRNRGLENEFVQSSVSFNRRKGTVRGLHYQSKPYEETKMVRCTMGAVYDVLLDLRKESPTYRRWHAVELSAKNRLTLYVPKGVAHGFQTLLDDSEVFYQMSEYFHPECAMGIKWDDPALGISWPNPITVISERDRTLGGLSA